jgi:hypothetical protein
VERVFSNESILDALVVESVEELLVLDESSEGGGPW